MHGKQCTICPSSGYDSVEHGAYRTLKTEVKATVLS